MCYVCTSSSSMRLIYQRSEVLFCFLSASTRVVYSPDTAVPSSQHQHPFDAPTAVVCFSQPAACCLLLDGDENCVAHSTIDHERGRTIAPKGMARDTINDQSRSLVECMKHL